jgi:ATP-dependent DNA helicase DinG
VLQQLAAALRRQLESGPEELGDAGAGEASHLPVPFDLLAGAAARQACAALDAVLGQLGDWAEILAEAAPGSEHGPVAAGLGRSAARLRRALAAITEPDEAVVCWADLRAGVPVVRAAPRTGERVLGELVATTPACIFTSATLTVQDRFDHVRARWGLPGDQVDELRVGSPFDLATQALLYIARDLPEPGASGFAAAALERMRELLHITAGSALVLFTTHRALREAAAALSTLPFPLLVQGRAPRGALLDQLRSTPGAVLLATGAFWEGIDVPGPALSLVIIDKLPFAPPTDPLIADRMRRIEAEGGDGFTDHLLPEAALALKQAVGRLIRRRDDRGIAAVLDRRILTRAYGRTLIESLPAGLRRTAAIEQVRRWWTRT